jgi:hypothetical protein
MLWLNVYKTSLSEGGLLCTRYYADASPANQQDFWNFVPNVLGFDLAFSGSQTQAVCVTAQPAGLNDQFAGNTTFLWAPTTGIPAGQRPVGIAAPWRWCLNVSLVMESGPPRHYNYHDAIDTSEIGYNERGNVVLKVAQDQRSELNQRFGQFGGNWPAWLMAGVGGGTTGSPLDYLKPVDVFPTGISIRNKQRRAQAKIFQQGISFQSKITGILALAGADIGGLLLLHSEDTGGWIRAELCQLTSRLIGYVVGLCQAHKDNNEGANNQDSNGGQGWLVRFGPTGANIAGKLDHFKQQSEDDLKYLQKFQPFADVSGDMYLQNDFAQEWFGVADSWVMYLGAFGGFDFTNPGQTGLKDMTRLDNYTPGYPDLPLNAGTLPYPKQNPERKVAFPGLLV